MVLGTSSAQYAFLQTLASTYVWTMYNWMSLDCISSPQIFTDCTDFSHYVGNGLPRLPTTQNFYTDGSTQTYSYSDYTSVTFSGITAKSFTAMMPNITLATRAVLAAACSANSTCAKQFASTANATAVINSLAATNINTIKAQLSFVANAAWFPDGGYALYSQAFTRFPDSNSEVYGLHNSMVMGFGAGALNASAFIQQKNVGQMLQGGASMYEALIHTAAIGSWSPNYKQQSNINLTAPQVFRNIDTGGGLDTRNAKKTYARPEDFTNKWQVWKAESDGSIFLNKDEIFESIKNRSLGHHMTLESLTSSSSNAFCSAPGNLVSGINWLQGLNNACSAEGFLSGATSLASAFSTANKALNTIAKSGIPGQTSAVVNKYLNTVNGVMGGWLISLCGAGVQGNPCYLGSQAWNFIGSEYTILSLLADVAEFSNPIGAVIGSADLFCALAPVAANAFAQDYACCSISCTGVSCQSSTGGCTQGTGVC